MLTKLTMARVIICGLYNLPQLPDADDRRVIRKTRLKKAVLKSEHAMAMKAIQSRPQ